MTLHDIAHLTETEYQVCRFSSVRKVWFIQVKGSSHDSQSTTLQCTTDVTHKHIQ